MWNSGTPLVIAAAVLGASILGGSLLIKISLDHGTTELAAVTAELRDFKQALAAAARPSRPTAGAEGPDPARRYEVDIDGSPVRGAADAQITLVEFSDFQCPFCRRATPTLEQIAKTYGKDVRLVFKHLPLPMHANAPGAHAAAEAAHQQGKFWEMHDLLFENQQELTREKYLEHAKRLGLDVKRFEADLDSAEVKARVQGDMADAGELGVSGTPAFFVNGRFISGAQPFETFQAMIDKELGRN